MKQEEKAQAPLAEVNAQRLVLEPGAAGFCLIGWIISVPRFSLFYGIVTDFIFFRYFKVKGLNLQEGDQYGRKTNY